MKPADIQKLGKYDILGELGKGAMGVVYKGFDPGIERYVAIKTVRKDLVLDDDEATVMQFERFKREAKAAGRLTHPNIVSVYEYGEDGATAYIAMEFITGKSLKDYFDADQRFDIPTIVRIMSEVLAALDYSHRNGIVHRDIKPANIMLTEAGEAKLADFGIARLESSSLTQAGTVLGTPSYMSPEQFMGQQVDYRSDLFSAGGVLYQLLTGDKPFTGSLTAIMHKVLHSQPEPPTLLNVQVPRAFDAVITKAMAKRPDERYQSAAEFAAAVKAAAEAKAAPPPPAGFDTESTVTDRTMMDPSLGADRAADEPVSLGGEARRRTAADAGRKDTATAPAVTDEKKGPPLGLIAAGVIGLLALGGGGAWFMLQAPPDEPPAANAAPVAAPDSAGGDEDRSVTVDVLANDRDPDGDPLRVARVDGARNGTATVDANGTVTYTPQPNFHGTESLTYVVEDGRGGTATAGLRITVSPVNDSPAAADDSAETEAGQPVTIAVLGNDRDPDGDTLSVVEATGAARGRAVVNRDNTVTYTPDRDFAGTETLRYTASDGRGGTAQAQVAVTVRPAPQPAGPSADEVLARVRDTLGQFDCALLSADLTGDGALAVSGVTGNPALPGQVKAMLADMAPGLRHAVDVTTTAEALCNPLKTLRAARDAAGGVAIRALTTDGAIHNGEDLIVEITAPDFPAYLQVDYFTLEGYVVHLWPNPLEKDNRLAPGATRRLGEKAKGGRFWTIGPPFGRELITVIASPLPLFQTLRTEAEKVQDYLPELEKALQTVRQRSGRAPTADALFIKTAP